MQLRKTLREVDLLGVACINVKAAGAVQTGKLAALCNVVGLVIIRA